MAAIMKPDSYHISGPIDDLCKSHGLWIGEGNSYAPLIYFKSPLGLKMKKCEDESWRLLGLRFLLELKFSEYF
jgi:hypothetical protein